MASEILGEAAALLKRHYGSFPQAGPPGDWTTLVRVVLESGHHSKKVRHWSWLEETALRTPGETAALSAPRLAESLGEVGHGARDAAVLNALAKWWLETVGDTDAGAVFHERSLETWQTDLRAIRGVSWELANRILLFVGGLSVYPLDRGSMRIAARHGWVDIHADYEDWQAFFVGGAGDRDVDLTQLSHWNRQLGREFCGAQPKCEECPLKALLPPRGPVPLDDQ
jgi:endonuclease III